MDVRVVYVCLLALLIDLVGTLAYSVRIVGVRTGRIALSFSLFNLMVLFARAANAFQAPLLTKFIELRIVSGSHMKAVGVLRLVLLSATVATLLGALLIPTFQRLFSLAVLSYSRHQSIPRLLGRAVHAAGRRQILDNLALPSRASMGGLSSGAGAPLRIIAANAAVVALGSCGTLAALYAGILNPSLRTTAVALTSAVNGLATLLLYLFVDPYLANLTDHVVSGDASEGHFRRCVTQMVGARLAGTLLGQVVLVPAAIGIAAIAKVL